MSDFPFSGSAPAEHKSPLPRAADVVVIGGGIAGISTAWELAGQGLKVVLCDKGRVGAEQSGRNLGWIRTQGRDPAEIPLTIESQHLWARWAQKLGPALGYRVAGVTYLARRPRDLAKYEAWLTHARDHDLDTRMLSRAEVAAQFPGAAEGHWIGALHTPSDAHAEPWAAVPMIARAVAAAGVVIREGCAVRALDIEGGRVRGVLTEAGRIRADAVVLAGGAWSSLLLHHHGVSLPQVSFLSSVAATIALPAVVGGALVDDGFALRRRADGTYTLAPASSQVLHLGPDFLSHWRRFLGVVGSDWRATRLRLTSPAAFPDAWSTARRWAADSPSPFEAMRVLNPAPDTAALERARTAFARVFPQLGRPKLRVAWAGMIDAMPDLVPVLDRVQALPGLVLGTGFSGHGFGIGPSAGRVLADLVTGRAPAQDVTRFRLTRFSDGSRLYRGPSL